MKKLISITLLLLLITPCLRAQKKEMSQARSYIKSGKDFDKAEQLLNEFLAADTLNRRNPKVYLLLYRAIREQYDAGNEKLYLKQKYDTGAFFNTTRRMFAVLESLDSIDAAPDDKGRVRLVFRNRHSKELDLLRPNLYNGGAYYIDKADYATAFKFFDAYIDCGRQPLFSSYDYLNTDENITDAAYWATFCGFKTEDAENTLKYSEFALRDTSKLKYTLRYVAEAYRMLGYRDKYLATLKRGFTVSPKYSYFFPRLIDYYVHKNQLDSALVVADRAVAIDGKDELFLLAKSMVLLNSGHYKECVALSDSLIGLNDTLADAYFNAGTAYVNQAISIEDDVKARHSRSEILELYRLAMPYMERYRILAPDDKQKWAPSLYKIYLNLNLGKQFEEIDGIINNE